MHNPLRILPAVVLALTLLSCSNGGDASSSNTYTDPLTIPTTLNTMIFSVDGSAIEITPAYTYLGTLLGDTVTLVAGVDNNGKATGVGLLGIHAAGTYPIGSEDTTGGNIQAIDMDYIYYLPGDTVKYLTPQPIPGSPSVGTLKLTELTATSIKATFTATLTKTQGIAGAPTIKIAGGVNAILPN